MGAYRASDRSRCHSRTSRASPSEGGAGIADRGGDSERVAVERHLLLGSETLELGEHLRRERRRDQLDVIELRRVVLEPMLPRERTHDLGANLLGIRIEWPVDAG